MHRIAVLQPLPRVTKAVVDQIAKQILDLTQRHLFCPAQQHVELTTALPRLAERGEDAVCGEGAVVDALNVVGAHGGPLPTHLRDEIIEQASFAHERIVQGIEQPRRLQTAARRGVLGKHGGGRHQRSEGGEDGWGMAGATRPRSCRYTDSASPLSHWLGVSAARC